MQQREDDGFVFEYSAYCLIEVNWWHVPLKVKLSEEFCTVLKSSYNRFRYSSIPFELVCIDYSVGILPSLWHISSLEALNLSDLKHSDEGR